MTHMEPVGKASILNTLPPEWPTDLMPEIKRLVLQSNVKIVVLDDDPTGTQTVHDIIVLTEWSIPSLCDVLADPAPVVYILTNSRSMSLDKAKNLNREIACNLSAARSLTNRNFVVISRSDSTLRGHYPGEVDALVAAMQQPFDGFILIPFFIEGGRLTIANTHYVTSGDYLIPVGETEYARDPVFGYLSSDLRDWVAEKNSGIIKPEDVICITLDDIRMGGPSIVSQKLNAVHHGQVCVVNAVTYRDLEVFVTALLHVESTGKRFLYRSAASFVRVRGGITQQPLLRGGDLDSPYGNGLVVAGSYVEKTTQQIKIAQTLNHITSVSLSVPAVLDKLLRQHEIHRAICEINAGFTAGNDVLLFTSREMIPSSDTMTTLETGQSISAALVDIVISLELRPAWIIAKGGITSSDIATQALGIRKGYVMGQVLPGIPVWRAGAESRFPGLNYIVFPGNVGDEGALGDIITTLRR